MTRARLRSVTLSFGQRFTAAEDGRDMGTSCPIRFRAGQRLYSPPMPAVLRFIEPCLPSPADRPPSGSNWIHEIKHDGYRLMARRDPVGIR